MPHDDGDRRAAWVATVTALVVVAAFIAGKAARDAILLSSFSIEALPIFITISALISFPVILIAGKLMTRFGPVRLMPPLNAISAALAILEWLLLPRFPRSTAVAIYFHISTSGAVLVSGFWSMINERFDVQSAKRHIGRIGMGATLGGIAGGIIAERTAVYLSANAILLVLSGLQLASAATLYLGRDGKAAAEASHASRPRFALRVVMRSRLLRNLGVVVVLGAIAACVLDYVFKADLVATSSKVGLLRSLAIYYTVTSVLTAVVQIVVSGPLLARLGVPRSVATLPLVVTAFGAVALAVPAAFAALAARAAETVTRSSIYRAGYELLYAPLPEDDKRPTKIVLDVGAERLGDLVGAQLVALIVYVMVDPRIGLLVATVVTGVIASGFALRLRHNYTLALEHSLVAQSDADVAPRWPIGAPIVGQPGDLSPLPLRILAHRRPAVPVTAAERDQLSAAITELRSREPARIKAALATELTPELAALAIGLVARDDVGGEALAALRRIAPRCTGLVVDALLDPTREVIVRRRLPDVLLAGDRSLAAWGLWRGLGDPSFEVRYGCGAALARLAGAGDLAPLASETVFDVVRRELVVDPPASTNQRVAEMLEHVFTVLGLVLPPEPLRIALGAVQDDDSALRATALEYLESVLPADVRAQLWPLLEAEAAPAPSPRSQDELVAAMRLAYQARRAAELAGSAT